LWHSSLREILLGWLANSGIAPFLCIIVIKRALRLLTGVIVLIAWPASTIRAQGTVSGQLTINERPGTRTTDLANAVVWLVPTGGTRNVSPTTVQIQMESRTFVPRVRVVPVGSTVDFPNQDPFRHNVFSKSGPGEFDLGLYGRGESKGSRFERPGVYPIFCNIHARMVAFVVAVPSQWVTQPGADGRFAIASVPAGKYSLRVWHDRGGEQARDLDVAADGLAAVPLQLDARGYRYVQHKNKFGQDYTTTGRDRY
jgi:plastocyanin